MNKIASNIQILLPFFRRKGKKISRVSIINNRYAVHNKFNPVIFPSQVSSKISRRLLYIFFFFFFTDDSNSNPAARNPIFLPFHYSPPLLPSSFNRVEIIVFNIPFLLPLYAPMVDISDKTREPCLILTEERESESERESARSYISSGFEVSHRSSDEDARKRAERIKGDYKLCPCYPRWKRLWIFYAGGGSISIGFSRHSRGHSIKNSVKPVLTSGAPLSAARVKEQSGRGRRLKDGGDHEEWRSSTKLVPGFPGWMKRYIYI